MTLKAQVIAGLAWLTAAKVLAQVASWAITIVVVRLLSPADYGLMAMGMLFVGFVALTSELGLGPAIVQVAEIDDTRLRRTFALIILVNGALFLLVYAIAPLIARVFDEPRLVPIVRVLAIQFVLAAFYIIPEALLERRLDFKRRSLVDLSSALLGSAATVALAVAGFGVWALVWGSLVLTLCRAVGSNIVSPFLRWPDFSPRGMRSLMLFGGQLTLSRILWYFYSQADVFIAGKLLGKELLGYYSIAMHLASLPVQRLSSIVNQVAFPAFARMQNEPEAFAASLLKAVRLMSFLAFPVLWGISCVAMELTDILLGSKWHSAALPLQILALIMPVSMVSNFLQTALQGLGRGDLLLKNLFLGLLIMPAAFWIGVQWGIVGLSLTWVAAFPLVFWGILLNSASALRLAIRDLLAAMLRPAAASCGMYAIVAASRTVIGDEVSVAARGGILVILGMVSYTALAAWIDRKSCSEILGYRA